MGSLIATITSWLGGSGPAIDCENNKVECCVTETHSNSSASSHGSRRTVVPERWETDEKIASHNSDGSA